MTFSYGLAQIGSQYLVAGGEGFLKLGAGREWHDAMPDINTQYPYDTPSWRIIGHDLRGNVYICGYQKANPRHFNLYRGHPEYRKGMPEDEREQIQDRLDTEQRSYPQLISLFAGKPGAWTPIDLPERIAKSLPAYSYLASVQPESEQATYVIGSDGLVMKGNPEDGFQEISSIVDREKHFSHATLFKGELVVATDDELLQFNGHMSSAFTPKVKVNNPPYSPQVAGLFAADNKLFLFDFTKRYRVFDDKEWQIFDIPEALRERPFEGLPSRP